MANNYLNAAYEQQLPSSPKAVLVALANRSNKEGICFPSVRTLSSDTGLSRSTIFRSLSFLVDDNLLLRNAEHRKDGSQKSSTYKLLLSVIVDKAKESLAAVKTKAVEMAKVFSDKPKVKATSALQLTYDSDTWSSTVEAIQARVLELYPNIINYQAALIDSIEDQLEYWMLKANSSQGGLKLTLPQLRAQYLRHEADYLAFLNIRS